MQKPRDSGKNGNEQGLKLFHHKAVVRAGADSIGLAWPRCSSLIQAAPAPDTKSSYVNVTNHQQQQQLLKTERVSPPWKTGRMAPPTMAMHITPEPWLVCVPSWCKPRLNMVGNMKELHKLTKIIAYIASNPLAVTPTQISAAAAVAQCLCISSPGTAVADTGGERRIGRCQGRDYAGVPPAFAGALAAPSVNSGRSMASGVLRWQETVLPGIIARVSGCVCAVSQPCAARLPCAWVCALPRADPI